MVAAGCEDVNELGATPLLSTAFRNYGDSLIEAGAPGAKREPDRAKPQLVVSSVTRVGRSDHPVCAFGASTPPLRTSARRGMVQSRCANEKRNLSNRPDCPQLQYHNGNGNSRHASRA